jgi:acyl carrier protein
VKRATERWTRGPVARTAPPCYEAGVQESADSEPEVMSRLQPVIVHVLEEAGRMATAIRSELSIIEDLGMDSVMVVDLTLAIEAAFDIAEFPMQAWTDRESRLESTRFTVGSLAREVARVLNEASGDREGRAKR